MGLRTENLISICDEAIIVCIRTFAQYAGVLFFNVDRQGHTTYPDSIPSPVSLRNSPAFRQDGMLRLFISHLATQKNYAGELKIALSP